MVEFDFDELDKQVNNLMSKYQSGPASQGSHDKIDKETVESGAPNNSETNTEEVSPPDQPNQDQTTRGVPPVRPHEPMASRRRGQFMDMKPSSRHQPRESSHDAAERDLQDKPVETPGFSIEAPAPVSPFLSDARVEKRPLGDAGLGISTMDPQRKAELIARLTNKPVAETNDSIDLASVEERSQVAEEQVSPTVILPRELQEDILKVESATQNRTPLESAGLTRGEAEELSQVSGDKSKPVRTRKGWLTVVVILLLAILSVAGGAGVYYLTNGGF